MTAPEGSALTQLEEAAVAAGRVPSDKDITAAAEQDRARGVVARVRDSIANRRAQLDADALEARQAADAIVRAEAAVAPLDGRIAAAWDAAMPALLELIAACENTDTVIRGLLSLPAAERVRGQGLQYAGGGPVGQQFIKLPTGSYGRADTASILAALLDRAAVNPTNLQPFEPGRFEPRAEPDRVTRGRAG